MELGGGGGGANQPPLVFNFQGLHLNLSLSLECLTKGGLKWTPFGSFKKGGNEMEPLNES